MEALLLVNKVDPEKNSLELCKQFSLLMSADSTDWQLLQTFYYVCFSGTVDV